MTILRRLSFLGLAFLPLLVIAACGDDGDGGGGEIVTDYPAAGEDRFESTRATVEIEVKVEGVSALPVAIGALETIDLEGPALIMRSDPQDSDGDGLADIQTEIVSMELTGTHPALGPITVSQDPDRPSTGLVEQQEPGQDFPADSFFDVFVQVEIPDMNLTAINQDALRMEATLTDLPPGESDGDDDVYRTANGEAVPLIVPTEQNRRIGRIVDALHIPNPPPPTPGATGAPTPTPGASPTATPTSAATPTPTDEHPPDVSGTYPDCTLEPQEGPGIIHVEFIALPEMLDFEVSQTDGTLMIDAPGVPQWVPIDGTMFPDGGFQGTGMGDVAGFPDTQVQVDGFFGDDGFSGTAQYGIGGELPGGDPAIYGWGPCPSGP